MAQIAYLTFTFIALTVALLLKFAFPSYLDDILGTFDDCNGDTVCLGNQVIYRITFGLFVYFLLHTILTFRGGGLHFGLWKYKFILMALLLAGVFFITNDFYSGWASAARYISVIFLALQIVFLLDLAYGLHMYMVSPKDDDEPVSWQWQFLYVILSLGLLVGAVAGVFLVRNNVGKCDTNDTVLAITCIGCAICMVLSVFVSKTSRGLLVPCFFFAYSIYVAWQGLASNPDLGCNAQANDDDTSVGGLVIGFVIWIMVVVWVANHSKDYAPTILATENDELEDEKKKVWFFHLVMAIGCIYLTMLFSNWGSASGLSKSGAAGTSDLSMWLKVGSCWFGIVLYLWTLVAPCLCPERFGDD